MLTIRPEQMQALAADQTRRFEKRALRHIEKEFPEFKEKNPKEKALELIRSGIEKARLWEIEAESHVLAFIELMIVYGADFDRRKWAVKILEETDMKSDARIELLHDRAQFETPPANPVFQ